MTPATLRLLVALALLLSIAGLRRPPPTQQSNTRSRTSTGTQLHLKITPDGDSQSQPPNKRRSTISPEQLDSLFGQPSQSALNKMAADYYEDEDDDEEEKEEEEGKDGSQHQDEQQQNQQSPQIGNSVEDISSGIRAESEQSDEADEEDDEKVLKQQQQNLDDIEFDIDLGRALEGNRLRRTVLNSITMKETVRGQERLDRGVVGERRAVVLERKSQYDPMLYGTYRKWKIAEDEREAKGVSGKQRGGAKGGAPSKSSVRGKRSKDDDKGGKKEGFYAALKRLGSGPSSGGSTGTGVADPPPNKKPITPKKAPTKRTRRKLITPGDIDSLFAKPQRDDLTEEEEDDDEDDEDDEVDDGDDEEGSKGRNYQGDFSSLDASSSELVELNSSSMIDSADAEVPEWLAAAEAERKASRKGVAKTKKTKKLTNDWRFWAAIVVTAGFASAFWSVYTQTGGFGGGAGSGAELII